MKIRTIVQRSTQRISLAVFPGRCLLFYNADLVKQLHVRTFDQMKLKKCFKEVTIHSALCDLS